MSVRVKDVSRIKEQILSALNIYEETDITIDDIGKTYRFFLVPDFTIEAAQIYGGILVAEVESKEEYDYLKTKYKEPEEGKIPYLLIVFYKDKIMLRDLLTPYSKRVLVKNVSKINDSFLKKLKKTIKNFSHETLRKLFDRKDLIDEFYQLFKKSRDYLAENVKGFTTEEDKFHFANKLLMEMMIFWFLQKKKFFNGDENYFITKFKEYKNGVINFNSYYEFLETLFESIKKGNSLYYDKDERLGKVVIVGPAPFLNGNHSNVEIPDEVFYQEGKTKELIETEPKRLSKEVPILNFLESRDWTEGNIDEYVLGAVYEKLINAQDRKDKGAYYTPEKITEYICNNTIKPYIIDKFNKEFKTDYSTINANKTIEELISNTNKEQLEFIFRLLKEIKIVDPACGSAHFLESAVNILVEIYEKLRDRARELGLREGFKIKIADAKGNLIEEDLLSIEDEEKFKLYTKFFIIISRNIYGVDIDPNAIQIARARMFLSLAKHFKVGEDEETTTFIRFPNVHFNLRVGNSLVGYVSIDEIGKKEEKRAFLLSLFAESNKDEKKELDKKIELVKEKTYINKVAKQLGIKGDLTKKIDELNKLLGKDNLNVNDFKVVLNIKNKLTQVLVASLSSERVEPLYELLKKINDLLSQKLDKKFAEDYDNISLDDLKKIKTFHWIMEFPDVFINKGAFDIVIGNPPYGAKLSQTERNFYKRFSTNTNTASLFIKRARLLSKFVSFIVPKSLTYSSTWQDDRKAIFDDLIECIDVSTAFKDVKLEQIIYIVKYGSAHKDYISGGVVNGTIENITKINKEIPKFMDIILTNIEDRALKIFNHIKQIHKLRLSDIARTFRGKGLQKHLKDEGDLIVISGKNIERYQIIGQLKFVNKEFLDDGEIEKFIKSKLIFQNIIAHIKRPYDHIKITGTFDNVGYITLDTVNNVISLYEEEYPLKFLLGLLNSEFLSWYVYRFVYNKAIRTMHFDNYFFEKILLPDFNSRTVNSIVNLVDSLLLDFSEEKYKAIEELILQSYGIEPDDLLGGGYGKNYKDNKTEEKS